MADAVGAGSPVGSAGWHLGGGGGCSDVPTGYGQGGACVVSGGSGGGGAGGGGQGGLITIHSLQLHPSQGVIVGGNGGGGGGGGSYAHGGNSGFCGGGGISLSSSSVLLPGSLVMEDEEPALEPAERPKAPKRRRPGPEEIWL